MAANRFYLCLFILCCQHPLAADVTFNRDIAPILAAKCYECHGPDAEQREAGLRLDDQQSATARLESGEIAIVAGHTSSSELLRRVMSTGDDRMPPADAGERLSEEEITQLRSWIEAGAEWQGHWAFEPFDRSATPAGSEWSETAIDRYIESRLESAGLAPAPTADRATLIRRLYFDLVGLPPSVSAVREFVADERPDFYERTVEMLLCSPAYGERWGRHWLDVARYGDSNGGDENHAYPHAHRYRDYVIEALNEDLTYDKFILQQLAGDLLGETQDERVNAQRQTATGYLAIGMKILAEQDPVKKQADMVDEQIDTFGRTFLGLSLGCARCHDHKFDPIPTKDYYALAGIFHSSSVGDRPLKNRQHQQRVAEHERAVAEANSQLDAIQESFRTLDVAAMLEREAESFDRGNVVIDEDNYGKGIGIISDPGGQSNFAEYDVEVEVESNYLLQLRYAALQSRPGQLLINGTVVNEDAIRQETGGWQPDAQRWHTEGVFRLKAGKTTIRLQSEPMMSHIDKIRIVRSDQVDVASIAALEKLAEELTSLRKQAPKATMVMAVVDGEVSNTKVHQRGSHLSLGDEVPRSFLEVLDGKSTAIPGEQSGRLQLAQWLTQNELAATLVSRVIVNRVWHWHFGRGLVASTDDFGIRGNPPTHPRLLDYLAKLLIADDWSLKALNRAIVTSQTYRMRSRVQNELAAGRDAGNELYWKRNRVRLDAESIRDALLSQSNELVLQLGKAPMIVKSQDPSPQDMAKNLEKYEGSRRRSVYLPVVRSNVYEFFTLFDFPNASTPVGKRNETTIPTQALWMLNSPFMVEHAERIASHALAQDDDELAIRHLYLLLFSREANRAEMKRGLAFLDEFTKEGDAMKAWTAYCQVLLSSNDFLFVR